ncbi:MAG: TlpA disulfide reductase family protein [Polyangiaceae bacterium]
MQLKPASFIQLAFIVVAAVAVFGFVRAAQNDQRRTTCSALCALTPAYAGKNRLAPDFELPDMNGKPVKLSSFRGKTLVVNFWTKTCKPCLEEMPALAELAKVARGRGDFNVLTISTDKGPDDVRDTLAVVLQGGEVPFTVLFDPDSEIVGDKYGTKLFPETWIIDPDGIIRARFDGARDWTDALAVDIAEMVSRPLGCPVEFALGRPKGKFAGVCNDDT